MKILERHHHSVCGQKSSVCSNRGHTSTHPHSPRRRLRQVLPILSEIKTYWEDLETEESSDVRPPWTHTLGLQKTCTDMQDSKTNSHFFLLSLRNLQAMSIATGQIHSFSSYHIHFSVCSSVKNVECNSRIWKTLWHSFQGRLRPLISIAIEMTSKTCHIFRWRYHIEATRPTHFMRRQHISMTLT
jgi:hypothetical protein